MTSLVEEGSQSHLSVSVRIPHLYSASPLANNVSKIQPIYMCVAYDNEQPKNQSSIMEAKREHIFIQEGRVYGS